jgi:hypothetical protein
MIYALVAALVAVWAMSILAVLAGALYYQEHSRRVAAEIFAGRYITDAVVIPPPEEPEERITREVAELPIDRFEVTDLARHYMALAAETGTAIGEEEAQAMAAKDIHSLQSTE